MRTLGPIAACQVDHASLEESIRSHPAWSSTEPVREGMSRQGAHSLSGYRYELAAALMSLRKHDVPNKVIVLARPRSGTTLLRNLLGQLDESHSLGEVLVWRKIAPLQFLRNLAQSRECQLFACKILSYQLIHIQRICNLLWFFSELKSDGYKFVHLRRRTAGTAKSLVTAQHTGNFHGLDYSGPLEKKQRISLDPSLVVRYAHWLECQLQLEDLLMSGFDHFRLTYERDLADPECHQLTLDRLAEWIGVKSVIAKASLARISTYYEIENELEVDAALRAYGYF